MRRSFSVLSGFTIALIVGLVLTLSPKTLLAQETTVIKPSVAQDDSKTLKKNKHKTKKQFKKQNKNVGLAEGKVVEVKEMGKIVDKGDKAVAKDKLGVKDSQ